MCDSLKLSDEVFSLCRFRQIVEWINYVWTFCGLRVIAYWKMWKYLQSLPCCQCVRSYNGLTSLEITMCGQTHALFIIMLMHHPLRVFVVTHVWMSTWIDYSVLGLKHTFPSAHFVVWTMNLDGVSTCGLMLGSPKKNDYKFSALDQGTPPASTLRSDSPYGDKCNRVEDHPQRALAVWATGVYWYNINSTVCSCSTMSTMALVPMIWGVRYEWNTTMRLEWTFIPSGSNHWCLQYYDRMCGA